MEHSRRGEGHENTPQLLPPVCKLDQHLTTELPVPEASVEDPTEWENSEPPTLPGYLTLEIDLNALCEVAPWRVSHNATSDGALGEGVESYPA